MVSAAGVAAFLLAMGSAASPSAQPRIDGASFTQWAARANVPLSTVRPGRPWKDLEPLGKMIGDATVVALSEAVHVSTEPLEFRNRLFQYLVEEKGYTAIAIESGIVEGRLVHDYVLGGPGDVSTVMAQGISWTFDRLPQNSALIAWIREYNDDPRHARKINFYGFDVAGSPGNAQANRNVDTALTEALKYLERVDSAASAALHARLDPLLPNLRFDRGRAADAPGYDKLSQAERNSLTAAISDLITLLERQQAVYTAVSSANDYEWAHRTALAARQVDGWLRQVPPEWQATSKPDARPREESSFLAVATDVRDRAQADNIGWVIEREGPSGRVLVYASRYHVSTAPLATAWWGRRQQVAGTYLRQRLGDRLLTVGNLINKGASGCGGVNLPLDPATRESIDGFASEVGVPLYLLDLRTAPAPVKNWLDQERQLGEKAHAFKLAVGKAFDVLLYMDTVTPGC